VRSGSKTSTHYFSSSGGPDSDPIKSVTGHVTSNLYFCIWCDLHVTSCGLVRPGREMSKHYFSYPGGPGVDPIKSAWDTLRKTYTSTSGAICVSHSAVWCIRGAKCCGDP
jgi:hypothetical protein